MRGLYVLVLQVRVNICACDYRGPGNDRHGRPKVVQAASATRYE